VFTVRISFLPRSFFFVVVDSLNASLNQHFAGDCIVTATFVGFITMKLFSNGLFRYIGIKIWENWLLLLGKYFHTEKSIWNRCNNVIFNVIYWQILTCPCRLIISIITHVFFRYYFVAAKEMVLGFQLFFIKWVFILFNSN
jgi:hypothetical protein